MRKQIRVLFLLLPVLMMNSCVLKRRPALAVPNISDRTQLELQLSQVAWQHAQCYLKSVPYSVKEVEAIISDCKQQLLGELNKIDKTKALGGYFKINYPTAGDALAGARISPCGGCASKAPKYQNIAYPQTASRSSKSAPQVPRQGGVPAPEDSFRSRTSQMFNWIIDWAAQRLTYKPDSSRFLVTLAVNSHDKDKAVVTLFYLDGGFVASITTPNSFEDIYRGLYRYTVEHPDVKPFDTTTLAPLNILISSTGIGAKRVSLHFSAT